MAFAVAGLAAQGDTRILDAIARESRIRRSSPNSVGSRASDLAIARPMKMDNSDQITAIRNQDAAPVLAYLLSFTLLTM